MKITTKVVNINERPIKIHGIPTGKLAIKKTALDCKKPGTWSTILSFKDKEFGDWLPIWSWVIEHPERVFLVDTGLSSIVNKKDYFKKIDFISRYYFEKQMLFEITRAHEIDIQLEKISLRKEDIETIILTHLHIDHTGGLEYFPDIPIIVNEKEWKSMDGAFPVLFPKSFKPTLTHLNEKIEGFENGCYVTKDKRIKMVETGGHTSGHSSVILESDEGTIFFAGDLAYNQERLLQDKFSSTISSLKLSLETHQKVRELGQSKTVVFLPTHDIESGERLASMSSL